MPAHHRLEMDADLALREQAIADRNLGDGSFTPGIPAIVPAIGCCLPEGMWYWPIRQAHERPGFHSTPFQPNNVDAPRMHSGVRKPGVSARPIEP